MRIIPRKPSTPEPVSLPWLPSTADVAAAARRLGCEPGTGGTVLGELHQATDHLWPAPPARAARPACQILTASRAATAEQFVTVAVPTVAERLAAIGLVYASGRQAVTS